MLNVEHELTPRWRNKTENTIFMAGVPISAGAELERDIGWPDVKQAEPMNVPAERIFAYAEKFGPNHSRPKVPYNNKFGLIFLPASPAGDHVILRDEAAAGPKYRALAAIEISSHVKIEKGAVFVDLGWPVDDAKPVNDEAREVKKYFEANQAHPHLLPAPWNDFTESLFLPALPEIEDQVFAEDIPFATGDRRFNTGRFIDPAPVNDHLRADRQVKRPRASRRRQAPVHV